MKLEQAKVSDLKRLEKNVRRHSDTQIKELIKSYEQFGQTRAIVVDEENNILIGNGLHMALERKGEEECTVYRKLNLSEKDKKKLILTDNKTYSLGIDDFQNIEDYIKDIVSEGDFDIAGFDSEFINQITKELEDITKDVQEYGIISLDEKKKLEKANTYHKDERDTKEKEDSEKYYDEETASENSKESEIYDADSKNVEKEEDDKKTCVCPNCGEVIPID